MDGKCNTTWTVEYCKNYTSDENGVIEYIIPRQNTEATEIDLEV